jgi:hypothetical protein
MTKHVDYVRIPTLRDSWEHWDYRNGVAGALAAQDLGNQVRAAELAGILRQFEATNHPYLFIGSYFNQDNWKATADALSVFAAAGKHVAGFPLIATLRMWKPGVESVRDLYELDSVRYRYAGTSTTFRPDDSTFFAPFVVARSESREDPSADSLIDYDLNTAPGAGHTFAVPVFNTTKFDYVPWLRLSETMLSRTVVQAVKTWVTANETIPSGKDAYDVMFTELTKFNVPGQANTFTSTNPDQNFFNRVAVLGSSYTVTFVERGGSIW